MKNFTEFFESILKEAGLTLSQRLNIANIRYIIAKINEYFYTNHPEIGTVEILGDKFEYFSEFHKFWEQYHEQILSPKIDTDKAELMADAIYEIYEKYDMQPFLELYDTGNLNKEAICQIRYFTANQDFRGSRKFTDFAAIYDTDPSIFDTHYIYESPEQFLSNLRLGNLSQTDKRISYAKNAANSLLELNLHSAIELFTYFKRDILKLKEYLLSRQGSGFGNKKIDMFIRDMVILSVWENPINFDKIDVASDINTIKVALRSGILKTHIPLVSSFLDIFCYQYELIDKHTANAYRKVWTILQEKYHTKIISPCLLDYLIYRLIGKVFCKTLPVFECEVKKHKFVWNSSNNKTCQICYYEDKVKTPAKIIYKSLPCQAENRNLFFSKNKILPGLQSCPFESVCQPHSNKFRKLNPPKSISILGKTGWTTAYTKQGEGGGGLMA